MDDDPEQLFGKLLLQALSRRLSQSSWLALAHQLTRRVQSFQQSRGEDVDPALAGTLAASCLVQHILSQDFIDPLLIEYLQALVYGSATRSGVDPDQGPVTDVITVTIYLLAHVDDATTKVSAIETVSSVIGQGLLVTFQTNAPFKIADPALLVLLAEAVRRQGGAGSVFVSVRRVATAIARVNKRQRRGARSTAVHRVEPASARAGCGRKYRCAAEPACAACCHHGAHERRLEPPRTRHPEPLYAAGVRRQARGRHSSAAADAVRMQGGDCRRGDGAAFDEPGMEGRDRAAALAEQPDRCHPPARSLARRIEHVFDIAAARQEGRDHAGCAAPSHVGPLPGRGCHHGGRQTARRARDGVAHASGRRRAPSVERQAGCHQDALPGTEGGSGAVGDAGKVAHRVLL
ncbi:hypothetical protein L1887_57550 [Cichorium endivia]|nr:hypothetical protein L1887_57550 [Cichorium endivia]